MILPEKCSIKVDGLPCQLAPTYVVSVASGEGEYMVAVVCDDHREGLQHRIKGMQTEGIIPPGTVRFESVKAVVTDCVTGTNEDLVDIELSRGIDSDRRLS